MKKSIENLMGFAQRLGDLIDKSGYSGKDVARVIGCSDNHISRYRTGKVTPPASVLFELSRLFSVSMDYLWTGSDDLGSGPRAGLETVVEEIAHRVAREQIAKAGFRDRVRKIKKDRNEG